jgi:hypothetical protein
MSTGNSPGSERVSRVGDSVLAIADFPLPIPSVVGDSFATKDCFGATPKVRAGLAFTRETRALPNPLSRA